MYGLVNKVIKGLVAENHGDEAGQQVYEIVEFNVLGFNFYKQDRT